MNLTPEQIDQLQAGRELDTLIAIYVMEWHGEREETFWPNTEWVWRDKRGYKVGGPTEFSTEIASAWRAVMKLRQDGWLFRIADGEQRKDILAAFWKGMGWDGMNPRARAVTDALAICRAALKAKLKEEKALNKRGEK
jgi:hypothetical protein